MYLKIEKYVQHVSRYCEPLLQTAFMVGINQCRTNYFQRYSESFGLIFYMFVSSLNYFFKTYLHFDFKVTIPLVRALKLLILFLEVIRYD